MKKTIKGYVVYVPVKAHPLIEREPKEMGVRLSDTPHGVLRETPFSYPAGGAYMKEDDWSRIVRAASEDEIRRFRADESEHRVLGDIALFGRMICTDR